ncbi:MAG: hypothetical protein OER95_02025, partial [Acidimicrobiia bacterium]|nr:hypothetical protein [Acidimicrobiia bacterium]
FSDGIFTVEDLSTGGFERLEVDTVIAAGNPVADGDLAVALADRMASVGASCGGGTPTITVIGDNLAPRTALEAVYEGHRIAREL